MLRLKTINANEAINIHKFINIRIKLLKNKAVNN
jgi:hypothetical protein